jgi:hypothetical protein
MPVKRCEVCGSGFSQGRGRPSKRCPACRDGGGRYGGQHRKLRAAGIDQAYGQPCIRCGRELVPGQPIHLDHLDGGGPADYAGGDPARSWSHSYCNTTAPHRTRAPGGWSAARPVPAVIPPAYEPGSIRHSPDCTCGGSVVYVPGEWHTSRCWVTRGDDHD